MPSAADFVDGFRRFWAAPSLDDLPALLAPEVKLVQPLAPVMRGLDEVRRNFGAIFAWLPDICGEVDRCRVPPPRDDRGAAVRVARRGPLPPARGRHGGRARQLLRRAPAACRCRRASVGLAAAVALRRRD